MSVKLNSKSQYPNPKQIQNSNTKIQNFLVLTVWILNIGAYLEIGACHLEFMFKKGVSFEHPCSLDTTSYLK